MTAVLVVVPTTAGPLAVRSLRARPGLPASAAFADGDYRPLPWSADYARLSSPGGPLATLLGAGPEPHELRLTGSFDAGRSWEVPVCLAQALVAHGHALTADPAEAGLILWATGAVDLDLATIPGDYALLDKLARSRPLLDAAPDADLVALLPEGPDRAEAVQALAALGRHRPPSILPAGTVAAALAALLSVGAETTAARPASRTRRLGRGVALVAGLGGLAVLSGIALIGATSGHSERPVAADRTSGEVAATPVAAAEPSPPPEVPISVDEVRARAGSSCRRVLFGADPPERRRVSAEASDRLQPSRLDAALCGLAFKANRADTRLDIGSDLRAASLAPASLGDGWEAYYFRADGRRERVYAIQVQSEAGTRQITHAIRP